jgi:pantoate kinase
VSYNGISYFLGLGDIVALGVLHLLYRPGFPSPEHFENIVQGWFLILHAVVRSCVEEYSRIPFCV